MILYQYVRIKKFIIKFEQKRRREHGQLIKRVYAECSSLFQLVKLINTLKKDKYDSILKKIIDKTHSYNGFALMLQGVSWTHMTLSLE